MTRAPYNLKQMAEAERDTDPWNDRWRCRWVALALCPWAAAVYLGACRLGAIAGTDGEYHTSRLWPEEGAWEWDEGPETEAVQGGWASVSSTSELRRACHPGDTRWIPAIPWIPVGARAVAWCGTKLLLLASQPEPDARILGVFTLESEVLSSWHPVAVCEVAPGRLAIAWLGLGDWRYRGELHLPNDDVSLRIAPYVSQDGHKVHVGLFDDRLRPLGAMRTFEAPHTVGLVFAAPRGGLLQIDAVNWDEQLAHRYEVHRNSRLSLLIDWRGGTPRRVSGLARFGDPTALWAWAVSIACLSLGVVFVHGRHALVPTLRGWARPARASALHAAAVAVAAAAIPLLVTLW